MSSFTNTPCTSTPTTTDEFDLQREELAKLQQTQKEWFERCRRMDLPRRIQRAFEILGQHTRDGLTISLLHSTPKHASVIAEYDGKIVFSWAEQFCALQPGDWLTIFEEIEREATQADAEWKEQKRVDELASLKAEVSSLKEKLGFTQETQ